MIIQEFKVPISLPSIRTYVGDPPIVEPLNNDGTQIDDQQLHNEIISNEHVDEVPQEPALRRFYKQMRSIISNDYVLYQLEYEEGITKDPISYSQAMKDVNSNKWIDAMENELNQ